MTPSEKKASEIEAKRLLDLLGLIDMGITFLEQEQEAVSILAPALDAAERRGYQAGLRKASELVTETFSDARNLTHDEA